MLHVQFVGPTTNLKTSDLDWVQQCDAIVCMPNTNEDAQTIIRMARNLSIPVYTLIEFRKAHPEVVH